MSKKFEEIDASFRSELRRLADQLSDAVDDCKHTIDTLEREIEELKESEEDEGARAKEGD